MPLTARAREWVRSIIQFALVLAVLTAAKIAIAEPYYVPSGSMEPTLLIGDELLATKYAYGYSAASLPASTVLPTTERILGALPERGDIVVFRSPGDRSQFWVKRVIGLPGDRIALHAGRVWINGSPMPVRADGTGEMEIDNGSTAQAPRFIETLPGGREHAIFKITRDGPYDDMREVTVPPGHVFVMGDNRDNSADSRVPVADGGVGMLPTGNLVGRVNTLVGSWDLGMADKPIWTWPSGLRLSRFFASVR
jgi:signal peptidase I